MKVYVIEYNNGEYPDLFEYWLDIVAYKYRSDCVNRLIREGFRDIDFDPMLGLTVYKKGNEEAIIKELEVMGEKGS